MIVLEKGLKSLIAGNATIMAMFPGGYFVNVAPERTNIDGLRVFIPQAPSAPVFSNAVDAQVRTRFTAYSKGGDKASEDMDTLMTYLLANMPSLSGWDVSNCVAPAQPTSYLCAWKSDSEEVWATTFDLTYSCHKN